MKHFHNIIIGTEEINSTQINMININCYTIYTKSIYFNILA